ncbi:glycosyltransferase family 39 protein [candidate division TA06 bacterium]|nr:glycosyltransferase family 39 protein [candidate division TA06 bacterium]
MNNRRVLIIFSLILSLGSALRFYGLDHESLENDELASWVEIHHENLGSMIEGLRYRMSPPLYHILLYFVIKHYGDSEVALRIPSAVSGVLSIIIIFFLGRHLYSEKEGLMAAGLTALLWCPVYYSQEARVYSLLLLFTLLSTYLWITGIREFDKGRNPSTLKITLYILTAIICAHLHYFGFYWIALQGLYSIGIFLKRPRDLVKISLVYWVIGIAYLPEVPLIMQDLHKVHQWIKPPGIRTFGGYARFLFNSMGLVFPVAGLYLFLFVRSVKKKVEAKKFEIDPLASGTLLAFWLVVPFMGVFITSIVSTPVLTYRNLILSLPPAYLLLSRAMTQLPVRSTLQTVTTVGVLAIFLGDLLFVKRYFSIPHKAQFRETVEYVIQHDDLYKDSMIIGWAWDRDYFNYYFERGGSPRRVDLIAGSEEDIESTQRQILSKNPSFIWMIQAHRRMGEGFRDFLDEDLQLIDHQSLVWAEVRLYKRRGL